MVAVGIAKLGILTLVAVGIALLQSAQIVGLGTGILSGGESELTNAACLAIESLQGLQILALLGIAGEFEAVLGLRQQILAVECRTLIEGARLLLCHFRQALTYHLRDNADGIVLDEIAQIGLLLIGGGIVLHHDSHLAHLHLLVFIEDIDGFLVVGHELANNLWSIGVNSDAAEEFLHLCLNMVNVDVANDDDGLIVRTVPLVIVCTQSLGTEAVDDRHQADGQTLAIL